MSKVDDLRNKYKSVSNSSFSKFVEADSTPTKKYLDFMLKTWEDRKAGGPYRTTGSIIDVVNKFHDLTPYIENKDIYSYGSNQEIVDTIKLAREKVTKSQVKKFETITLHEDDRFLVIQPLTSRSSNVYGKSTKWCVSSDQNDFKKYFNQYTDNGVLVFVIDKSIKEEQTRDNIFSKVAFHNDKTKTGHSATTIWDSKDIQVSAVGMMELMEIIPQDVMKVVNTTLKGKTNKELAKERGIKDDTYKE